MMDRLNSLRKTIEKLLPDVDGVLAPRSGPSRVVSPYLFCKEHLEELANLAIWPEQPMSEALELILRAHPGAKLAIVCRGCEERGIIEMFKDTQLSQDNVTLIGLRCKQSEAKFCRCAKTFNGRRDKAILLALLDTGARAQELVGMKLEDFNRFTGEILIHKGKGVKYRYVFLGKTSRQATRAYLNLRSDKSNSLWVSHQGEQLTYWSLREIIRRRSIKANIKSPALHSFRRAFAINMLRVGVGVFSL